MNAVHSESQHKTAVGRDLKYNSINGLLPIIMWPHLQTASGGLEALSSPGLNTYNLLPQKLKHRSVIWLAQAKVLGYGSRNALKLLQHNQMYKESFHKKCAPLNYSWKYSSMLLENESQP